MEPPQHRVPLDESQEDEYRVIQWGERNVRAQPELTFAGLAHDRSFKCCEV